MPDADRKLMTIFAEALERTDPAARAAYLDSACEGDAALLRRVQVLLAAHDRPGPFLEPNSTEMSENVATETEEATEPVCRRTMSRDGAGNRGRTTSGTITTIIGAPPADRAGGFVAGPGHRRPLHAARSSRRGGNGHRLPG